MENNIVVGRLGIGPMVVTKPTRDAIPESSDSSLLLVQPAGNYTNSVNGLDSNNKDKSSPLRK